MLWLQAVFENVVLNTIRMAKVFTTLVISLLITIDNIKNRGMVLKIT